MVDIPSPDELHRRMPPAPPPSTESSTEPSLVERWQHRREDRRKADEAEKEREQKRMEEFDDEVRGVLVRAARQMREAADGGLRSTRVYVGTITRMYTSSNPKNVAAAAVNALWQEGYDATVVEGQASGGYEIDDIEISIAVSWAAPGVKA